MSIQKLCASCVAAAFISLAILAHRRMRICTWSSLGLQRNVRRVIWIAITALFTLSWSSAAFCITLSISTPLQTFVKPPPTNFARFGESVVAVGSNVLVSGENCHAAYLFSSASGSVLQTFPSPGSNDFFGASAASAGNLIYVGAPGDDARGNNAGAIHLFDATSGSLLRSIYAPTPHLSDEFGYSLAARGDRVLVGGSSNTANASVYLFDSAGHTLLTIADPLQNVSDRFGEAVAFVGNDILVAAPGKTAALAGSVYLFDGDSGNLLHTFHAPHPTGNDWFGYSVSAVGNNILIGAGHDPSHGTNTGAAYYYAGDSGNLIRSFFNPATNGTAGYFGSVVGSVGGHIAIGGADYQSSNDGGAVWLFNEVDGSLLETVRNPTFKANTGFGTRPGSLADVGGNIALGAWADGTYGFTAGVAYLFQGPAVPEPGSFVLAVLGIAAVAAWKIQRRVGHHAPWKRIA